MRHKIPVIATLAVGSVVLAGCAQPQLSAEHIRLEKSATSVVTYPTEIRGVYVVDKAANAKLCAEPPPDVALNTLQKISADLKAVTQGGQEVTAGVDGETATTAIELAGRTQLILLTRELLYRLCELSLNYGTASDVFKETASLYGNVIAMVQTLATSDRLRAEARLERARALAKTIIVARDARIEAIVTHVAKADGTLDPAKLKALLDRAPDAEFVRQHLESASGPEDLRARLVDVPRKVIDQMFAALP